MIFSINSVGISALANSLIVFTHALAKPISVPTIPARIVPIVPSPIPVPVPSFGGSGLLPTGFFKDLVLSAISCRIFV